MVREINGIAELKTLVGQPLGESDWLTITQEQIQLFADATGDQQWIHVDVEKAKDGPYGTTIAHGFLTSSLIPVLASQIYDVTGMKMRLNYGSNKVRFPHPVPVGSKVRLKSSLQDVIVKPSGTQAVFEQVVEIEGADKPACIAETVTLLVE